MSDPALVAPPDHRPSAGLRALIDESARTRPQAEYLADARSSRVVTFAVLARRTAQWARRLDEHGVATGCAIVIDVEDPIEFAVAHLAVIASGRCAVPVDPAAPAGDLRRTIAATRPVLMISNRPARPELGVPTLPIGDEASADPGQARPAHVGGAVRLSTSGSTGAPKTVELDEARLLHVARAVADHNRLGPDDRGYNALPLFHINAEVVALLATLVAGGGLVLDRRFHRTGFWTVLRDREITWVNAVPAMLAIAVTEPVTTMPGLRFIRSASAPLAGELKARVEALTGVAVIESYGMTEAASQITATPLGEPGPAGSAGRPVGVELQIRAADGVAVPAGSTTIGAVWIRGAGVITSYLDGRAAERFDAEGWLRTGDLGHLDADGFLHLAGRADDVINRGGEMVYPREIEEVLAGDPRVREAIVVPRPDPVLGSVPVAYVLLRTDAVADEPAVVAALEERCRRQLSRFKRPAEIAVVPDLPRAATGKVLRHRLRHDGPAGTGRDAGTELHAGTGISA